MHIENQDKAQIFLSCGQASNEEQHIAKAIKREIESMGEFQFHCYVSIAARDAGSLIKNIFDRLEETDYFVFVDFKRERLGGLLKFRADRRGSLFTNQELAVFSYLRTKEKEEDLTRSLAENALFYQEKGVKPLDGMLGAIQGNVIRFSKLNRNDLPRQITDEIRKKCRNEDWSHRTRNRLELSVYPDTKLEQGLNPDKSFAQPFHIKVSNLHHRKDALNCFAYLDKAEDWASREKLGDWETAEFKWAGTRLAAVRIAAGSHRILDAAWLYGDPKKTTDNKHEFFDKHSDPPTDYYKHKLDPGRYRLTYRVVSDNFKPVTKEFMFEFAANESLEAVLNRWKSENGQPPPSAGPIPG